MQKENKTKTDVIAWKRKKKSLNVQFNIISLFRRCNVWNTVGFTVAMLKCHWSSCCTNVSTSTPQIILQRCEFAFSLVHTHRVKSITSGAEKEADSSTFHTCGTHTHTHAHYGGLLIKDHVQSFKFTVFAAFTEIVVKHKSCTLFSYIDMYTLCIYVLYVQLCLQFAETLVYRYCMVAIMVLYIFSQYLHIHVHEVSVAAPRLWRTEESGLFWFYCK